MIHNSFEKKSRSTDWQGMLTEMEKSVASALADAKARERALRTDPLLSESRTGVEAAALADAPVQAHLDSLRAYLNEAEANVDKVGKMLDEGKASVLGWQERARELRQRLEAWMGLSVR